MSNDSNFYNQSEILSRINKWISNGDSKISFALAFTGALIGVFFTSSTIQNSMFKVLNMKNNSDSNTCLFLVYTLILIAFVICLIVTVWNLLKGLKGKIDISAYEQQGIKTNSLLFFGSIQSMEYEEFRDKVQALDYEKINNDYMSQIYINSIICENKFEKYNKGIKFLMSAIVLFVLLNTSFLFI